MDIRHPEWRASHDATKYPFGQDCSLSNTAGDVIFETTFLDASFYIVGAQAGVYLSRVSIDVDNVTIYVGDPANAQLAFGTFPRATPPSELRFVDNFNRPAGVLVSEEIRMALFSSWPIGDHDFSPTATQFVARCCHAMPQIGVRGFELDDGSILTGDVWLVGDDGVVLSCDTVQEATSCGLPIKDVTQLRIDVVGDSLFRRKLCSQPDFFETPHYLETITFCAPGLDSSYSSYVSSEVSDSSELSSCEPIPTETDPELDILILTDTTLTTAAQIESWKADWVDTLLTYGPLAPAGAGTTFSNYSFKFAVADYRDYTDGTPFDTDGFRILQPFTDDVADAMAAVNAMTCAGGGDIPQETFVALLGIAEKWTDPAGLNGRAGAYKLIILGNKNHGHVNCPGSTASALPYATFYPSISADCQDYSDIRAPIQAAGIEVLCVNMGWDGGSYSESTVLLAMSQMIRVLSGDVFFKGSQCFTALPLEFSGCLSSTVDLLYYWISTLSSTTPGEPCEDTIIVTPVEHKTSVVNLYPPTETMCVKCGPGEFGDVKIFVHSNTTPDTILRVRPVFEGLKIEVVGESLETK